MGFRLTCISTVCSTARLGKHERRHQSFGSFMMRIERNGDTAHWATNVETFNQASTFHQQYEMH